MDIMSGDRRAGSQGEENRVMFSFIFLESKNLFCLVSKGDINFCFSYKLISPACYFTCYFTLIVMCSSVMIFKSGEKK